MIYKEYLKMQWECDKKESMKTKYNKKHTCR